MEQSEIKSNKMEDNKKNLDRAHRQIRASDIRWETLFHAAADPIIIGDDEGVLVCNPRFEEITGLSSDQVIGIPITSLPMCNSDPDDCRVFMKYWREPSQSGSRFTWHFINFNGRKVVLDIQIKYIQIEGILFRFCIGRDITHEIELLHDQEVALLQIEKNMAQMAALNDEIRNPLTIITMSTDDDNQPGHEGILKGVKMINNLVDRLDQGFLESEKVRRFLQRTIKGFMGGMDSHQSTTNTGSCRVEDENHNQY
jgi:PAS domain S-box-containing protein